MDYIYKDGELYHHGVKGMKWGVRRTPEQLGHKPRGNRKKKLKGSPSAIEKAKKAIARYKQESAAKKSKKQAEEEAKKNKKAQVSKEDLLKSRDARLIYQNAHLLSDQELRDINNRLVTERNIKKMADENTKSKVDKLISTGKTLNDALDTGSKFYNNIAKIANAFGGTDLPIVGETKGKGKNKGDNKSDDKSKDNDKGKNESKDKGKNEPTKNKPKSENKIVQRVKKDASDYAERKYQEAKQKVKDSFTKKSNDNSTKNSNDEPETVTGTVFGTGKSKSHFNSGKKWWEDYSSTSYDVDFDDVSSSTLSLGRSYVDDILLLPAPKDYD